MSLVPSATETLLAWGVVPVGVTRFCEQPHLPAVGGTKDPDVGRIVALRPDLVVVNDEENRSEDADALTAAGLELVAISPRTVADVGPALATLAAACGLDAPPGEPAAHGAAPPTAAVLDAFVPVWRQRHDGGPPSYTTLNDDTYGSSLLAAVGVGNAFGDALVRYPEVSSGDVRERAAAVVLAPSEPYPFSARHDVELAALVPSGRVVFVDGQDLFWWGVRTALAMGRLRSVVDSLTTSHG